MVRMDITPFVESLRADLVAAADAGGPDVRAAADRLALALEPAVRLTLMDALSQAAAEITSELGAGSVEVRLRGREPELVVDVPTAAPAPAGPPAPAEDEPEDGNLARITLRIPEGVKNRAEEIAGQQGASLNSWIVGVLRQATNRNAVTVDIDLSSIPFDLGGSRTPGRPGRRMSGWV